MLCRYNTNTLTCCNGSSKRDCFESQYALEFLFLFFYLDTKRLHQTRSIYYTCLETPPSPCCWTEKLGKSSKPVKLTTAYPKIVRPCSIKPLEYAYSTPTPRPLRPSMRRTWAQTTTPKDRILRPLTSGAQGSRHRIARDYSGIVEPSSTKTLRI